MKWSATTNSGDSDIKTSECVAYDKAQLSSTYEAEDDGYEVVG